MRMLTKFKSGRVIFALLLLVLCSGKSWGQEIVYETGFEAGEEFATSTVYNNPTIVYRGPEGMQWGTVYGTPSTANRIEGEQSMQMRIYKNQGDVTPYTEMNFDLENVVSVEFQATYTETENQLLVQHSTDGGESWSTGETFTLGTSAQTFTYNIGETVSKARFRFSVVDITVTETSRVTLDNVKVYGKVTQVATPVFSPEDDTRFTVLKKVSLSCETENARIYYTLDGTEPSESSMLYTDPIWITETTTIKAKAFNGVLEASETASLEFVKVEQESGEHTATQTSFTAVNASSLNGDGNVSYTSQKGGGTSEPAINSGEIRLYQNNGGAGGGTITLSVTSGYKLKSVTIGSSMQTSIAYTLESETEKSATENLAANGTYTVEDFDKEVSSITFYCMGSDKESRLYVNHLSVTYESASEVDGYTRTVTANTYGTICLPYAVAAEDLVGAEFFSIAGKVTGTDGKVNYLVLDAVTELEAGKPYIFSATSDMLLAAYNGEAVAEAASDNGLKGTFTGQDVAEGMYMITDNTVQLCGTGCSIAANRAYINMDEVAEYTESVGVNQRMLPLDGGTTGIETVEAAEADALVNVYTLSGVEVRHQVRAAEATDGLQRGIYIVNGKKMIVK